MDIQTKLYINGEFRQTAETQRVIDPSTGETIAEVYVASNDDVEDALSSARCAFDHGEWPRMSCQRRAVFLRKIAQGIFEKAGELAHLESLNTGKPIKETTFMDIPSAARIFEHAANRAGDYLAADSLKVDDTAHSSLLREPLGVATLIVPWNYPLLIACWKLASALAAGNTVILKPSSLAPLTALELARIVHSAGLPPGVVNIIAGSGSRIGEKICSDKRVDMISFTGSNETGRKIMSYSAEYVKKLVMELGGKSASLVFKDADLELAVNGSLCSIFLNQGQMCTAMSRIFVEDDIYDDFAADFTAKTRRIKLGPGTEFQTQMGPLISDGQRRRVVGFLERAQAQGATVLCGGKIPPDAALSRGFFFEPAVLAGVTPQMEIFREEVFGPVVCISRFSDDEDGVLLANNCDFGLAAALWSKDAGRMREIAQRINAGIIWINTYGMFFDDLPYGGFKQSGFGKELGREGMREYTRLKNVVTDTTVGARPLVNYWYGF